MSYTKREWATGNVVGAVDLNRMEEGIEEAGSTGGGALVVRVANGDIYDKTWQEVYDAYEIGLPVYLQKTSGTSPSYFIRYILIYINERQIDFCANYQDTLTLYADSPTGYLYYEATAL